MAELTDKQINTRWGDVKKILRKRQLLAYRLGIPLNKFNEYMYHKVPPRTEVIRIYEAIKTDRREKTNRLKENLKKMVGYRENNIIAKKIGISDTTLRQILTNKNEMAGYDIIDKVELYIKAVNPDFEISIENTLSVKEHLTDHFLEIADDIKKLADKLYRESYTLLEIVRQQRLESSYSGEVIHPSRHIDYHIIKMQEIKENIDLLYDVYIKDNKEFKID